MEQKTTHHLSQNERNTKPSIINRVLQQLLVPAKTFPRTAQASQERMHHLSHNGAHAFTNTLANHGQVFVQYHAGRHSKWTVVKINHSFSRIHSPIISCSRYQDYLPGLFCAHSLCPTSCNVDTGIRECPSCKLQASSTFH